MPAKHYYYFGKDFENKLKKSSLDDSNWDILRTDESEGPFSIEKSIESYEKIVRLQLIIRNLLPSYSRKLVKS